MFSRYFGNRYFPVRFWPDFGSEINLIGASAYVRVTVPRRARRIVVPPAARVTR